MTSVSPPQNLGDYELLKPLARGGMGVLFLARKRGTTAPTVVIKSIHARTTRANRDQIRMFLDEARVATLLNHPNIVKVHEVDFRDGYYYLVMEWLVGWDLRAIVQRLTDRREQLPVALVMALMMDACRGLHGAHVCTTERGEPLHLVHRDINPANLFVTREGVLKLLDFGVAKSRIQVAQTQVGTIKGKIPYMSPEQCRAEPLDARSDVFSLGIVFHELLAGGRLFKYDTPQQIMRAIARDFIAPPTRSGERLPEQLVAITMRALQRDKDLRHPSAEALKFDLANSAIPIGTPADVSAFLQELFAGTQDPSAVFGQQTQDMPVGFDMHTPADQVELLLDVPGGSAQIDTDVEVAADMVKVVSETGPAVVHDTAVDRVPKGMAVWLARGRQRLTPKKLGVVALVGVVGAVCLGWALDWWPTAFTALLRPGPNATAVADSNGKATSASPATEPGLAHGVGIDPLVPPPVRPTSAPPSRGAADKQKTKATAGVTPRKRPPVTAKGRLTLESKPWANVWLGDRKLGSTPLVELELPAGDVSLRLVNPDLGAEMTITVPIPADGRVRKVVTLPAAAR